MIEKLWTDAERLTYINAISQRIILAITNGEYAEVFRMAQTINLLTKWPAATLNLNISNITEDSGMVA